MIFEECSNRINNLQILKLIDSIYNSDFESIERLCQNGLNNLINFNEPFNGKTALITGVQIGSREIVKYLLKNGADPNVTDFQKRSPLMFACLHGDPNLVKALCENSSDLKLVDTESKTCLSYCFISSSNKHLDCLNLLLKYGADCNQIENGKTPFLEACERSYYIENFCISLFLNGKADYSVFDNNSGNIALHYSALNGSVNLTYYLLKNGSNPNSKNFLGQTPSHLAAERGHLNILRLLWSYGADFNTEDINQNPVINYLFKNFDFENKKETLSIVKFLSSRNSKPFDKNTQCKFFKENLKFKKIKILTSKISRNAFRKFKDINSSENNETDETLKNEYFLFWTIKLNDFFQALSNLIESFYDSLFGIEENLDRISFKTFFKKIFTEKIPEIILNKMFDLISQNDVVNKKRLLDFRIYKALSEPKFRLEKGLKLKPIRNLKSKTSSKKVQKTKRSTSKIFIPIKNLNPNNINYQFKKFECNDPLRFKNSGDIKINHKWTNDSKWYLTCKKRSKLEISNLVNSGDLVTLEKILSQKSPKNINLLLNSKDKYHKTPLMLAVIKGNLKMIDFLLQYKIDVNQFDNFKWTALHHAVNFGNLEIVKKLISKNANKNLMTINNRTAIDLGRLYNQKEIVECLKK
ncbi:unnamed protein product [Brachionus calyciflorus]|uniref:Uncharacterized protein n=1 Tax=Brachionus calyciflorus TaxID=104777 RepID=A0A813Q9N5_9BILA|nr:unnamed protein product [Brachionus calyciflorus]